MATVTPQMVKELRESTGAGMTDCKKALDEAAGDMDAALKVLRERGLAAAAKKSSRAASEGVVASVITNDLGKGYLVEVNCETDFVTRNEEFQAFVVNLQSIILKNNPTTVEALTAASYTAGGTVAEATLSSYTHKMSAMHGNAPSLLHSKDNPALRIKELVSPAVVQEVEEAEVVL